MSEEEIRERLRAAGADDEIVEMVLNARSRLTEDELKDMTEHFLRWEARTSEKHEKQR